jgi:hypothetical protein
MTDRQKWYRNIYLKSDHWQSKREEKLKFNPVCEMCGSNEELQIHHLNYDNQSDEQMEDLQTLCRKCHMKKHNKKSNRKLPKSLVQSYCSAYGVSLDDSIEFSSVDKMANYLQNMKNNLQEERNENTILQINQQRLHHSKILTQYRKWFFCQ